MQKFSLSEDDYLDFLLFTDFRSKFVKRRIYTSWILVLATLLTGSIWFYATKNQPAAMCSLGFSIIAAIGLPAYTKWRYKLHYRTYIIKKYERDIGSDFYIDFGEDYFFMSDSTGESRTFLKEIEQVDETNKHYFIKLKKGNTIIIPKVQLNSWTFAKELENVAMKVGITINKVQSDKNTINLF
jgi:YcxB-like protein